MSNLLNTFRLTVGQHVGLILQWRKGIVGSACDGDTALEAVCVIAYHTVEGVGRSAHGHVPKQVLNVNVHGISTLGFAVVLAAIVALTQHHREIAHRGLPFLRHRIGFRRE